MLSARYTAATKDPAQRARRGGFTLAESLVASVILALGVVGISGALIASQQQTRVMQDDVVAALLARQLMEQIASLPIAAASGATDHSGWPTTQTPSLYDSVDDYNGYRDLVDGSAEREQGIASDGSSLASSAALDCTIEGPGATLPTLQPTQYIRSVTVAFPTQLATATVAAGDMALVTVSVQSGTGNSIKISRLLTCATVGRS